ncbi:MAG: FHA domain-containing protein [Elusimicrobiota bacterium]
MAKLLLKFNAAVIREFLIDKERLSVGRMNDNDLVIDHPLISGHHCRICFQGGGYSIEDLESTNGTYVNDQFIKKSDLRHNDVISLARHTLIFLDETGRALKTTTSEASGAAAAACEKEGWLRVLKGAVAFKEYPLKALSTYIGRSDRAQVPIRGSGFFKSAPEVAASVHRKSDGYILVAVAEGYPVVNGQKVVGSIPLKEGDIIDCGSTTLQLELRDPS